MLNETIYCGQAPMWLEVNSQSFNAGLPVETITDRFNTLFGLPAKTSYLRSNQ
jgi:hypothetical protein